MYLWNLEGFYKSQAIQGLLLLELQESFSHLSIFVSEALLYQKLQQEQLFLH